MTTAKPIPAVTFVAPGTIGSSKPNALGMRLMQERAYNKRGETYLLIKAPPASGKSRALMFIALDKLHNQGLKQAIIAVPEKSIGGSFADEPLTKYGFWADWTVKPHWNLCNAPGPDEEKVDASKVKAVGQFLASDDKVLVCTHATFRFAVDELGVEAFDDRVIAIDEFHHVSASDDNRLGSQLGRRDLPLPHQLSQRYRILASPLVPTHGQSHVCSFERHSRLWLLARRHKGHQGDSPSGKMLASPPTRTYHEP